MGTAIVAARSQISLVWLSLGARDPTADPIELLPPILEEPPQTPVLQNKHIFRKIIHEITK